MSTSTVRVVFLGDASSALRSVKTLGGGFSSLDRAAGLAARTLAVGIVGGLAAATKAAVEFDRGMRNVNSIAKLNERQLKALSKQVLALSKESGQAPKTLAAGLYDVVSSGFKAADGMKVLRASAKAATAGLTDTATATKAIVASLNAYHLGAGQAQKVSDILFQTVNKGVLTFEELSGQIGDVLPAASALGVPLEDVGGALATITLHGVNAAEAATQTKQVLVSLLKPSKELKGELKGLGFESGQAALKQLGLVGVVGRLSEAAKGNNETIADWFPNVRALSGFFGLAGKNLTTFTANTNSMRHASDGAGATAAAFAEQGKSIAFQWQRAKASLTAAAIPVGQLLFPLLAAGAGKVEDFARAVESHMPAIQAQFGDLARGAGELAGALGEIGSSRGGQVAIASLASALAGAKLTSGVQNMVTSLKGINPVVAIVATAFGILGGVIYADVTRVRALEQAFNNAKVAALGLTESLDSQKQAHLNLQGASIALETAQMNLGQAQKYARETAAQYGAGSSQHKNALLNVEQAANGLAQAKLNLARTTKAAETADDTATVKKRASAKAIADLTRTANGLRQGYENLVSGQERVAAAGGLVDKALTEEAQAMRAKTVNDYATAMADLSTALGGTKADANAVRDAVIGLTASLGRLPTAKEIRINVRMVGTQNALEANRGSTAPLRRAGGGFIPGSPTAGDSVHTLLTPGEVVLNREQQDTLGGPGFFRGLFGFRGEGPTFAMGGIVARGFGDGGARAGRPSPHRGRPRARTYRATSDAARAAVAAVTRVNQQEQDLDRSYGQLARQLDISQETFVVSKERQAVTKDGKPAVDEDGIAVMEDYDVVDQAAVGQRVSEIDRLVGSRREMLAKLDEEKRQLEAAIERLRVAVQRLLAAIKQEQDAARADAREAARLASEIGAATRQATGERRKSFPAGKKGAAGRKARDSRVNALEDQISRARGKMGRASDSQQAHLRTAQGLNQVIDGFQSTSADLRQNLLHELPFDRRDVSLDIDELLAERSAVAGTSATNRPSFYTGGGSSSSGSSGSVSAGQGDLVADLIRRLGQANLALGIQAVQLPIVGSFARGTVHVSETGLAMVHAGERIQTAAAPVAAGGGDGPAIVYVTLAGGLSEQSIDAKIEGATRRVAVRIGQDADTRRRAGTY